MATAVLSHFILDAIVHNPDIDLLGNGIHKIGLGLWNNPYASYTVEALLLVTGLWIYLRTTKSTTFTGKYGLPILSAILLTLNAVNTFGLYPTNTENFAMTMLTVYLGTIAVTFWLDRKRFATKMIETETLTRFHLLSSLSPTHQTQEPSTRFPLIVPLILIRFNTTILSDIQRGTNL
jgi:hypothetical protein